MRNNHAAVAINLASPINTIATLLKIDRRLATLLITGLAVFACASIARTWSADKASSVLISAYVIGFGALITLISLILHDHLMKKVLGWFVTIFVMVVISTFFISAAFPSQTFIAPTYCLARFWEPCLALAKDITNRLPGEQVKLATPAPESARVNSFTVQTADVQEEQGIRFWIVEGDHWVERYPSGKTDQFIKPARLTLDGCDGTGVVRQTEQNFTAFIPDKGCPIMAVRWRRDNSPWYYLGLMRDVR